jgi:hypothetical protein
MASGHYTKWIVNTVVLRYIDPFLQVNILYGMQ